jgi:hypothetical protein
MPAGPGVILVDVLGHAADSLARHVDAGCSHPDATYGPRPGPDLPPTRHRL